MQWCNTGKTRNLKVTKVDHSMFNYIWRYAGQKKLKMAKGLKKMALIEIEYESIKELQFALSEIGKSIGHGTINQRQMIAHCLCQWSLHSTIEPDFRVEEINGKRCMIFKSKMNDDGK